MSDLLYDNYTGGKLDTDVYTLLYGLSKSESRPLAEQTPEEVRKGNSILGWIKVEDEVNINNITIEGRNGDIPLRIYSPKDDKIHPVIIYLHGGGWVFGSLDEADHICSAFCNRTPAVVVSVGYRLSPENKCPKAIEDCYDALLWVSKNIGSFKGDCSRISVAGESAGATMSTIITQMARDNNAPAIKFQLLICPVGNLYSFDTESYKLFGNGIWLSKRNMGYYRDQFLINIEQAKEKYISPLLQENLRNLPQAHILTAEFDVLRDDGEEYAKKLSASGNKVTHKRYDGVIHSFILLNKVINKANIAIMDCVEQFRNNL